MASTNPISLPILNPNEIHIWWANLTRLTVTSGHWKILDASEQERALRFKRECDRDQYVLTRSLLRTLLSSYTHIPGADIRFCYGCKGKPALLANHEDDGIEFNVSHSRKIVVWGFSRSAIGVDVEYIKSDFDADGIARRFFTEREYGALKSQPLAGQQQYFFQLWTRKESSIKALGASLFEKIGQLEVPCSQGDSDGDSGQWASLPQEPLAVRDLNLHPEYCAAIATESQGADLKCFEVNAVKGLTHLFR